MPKIPLMLLLARISHLGDFGTAGKIILKYILKKYYID
jgi:hypothetical protein